MASILCAFSISAWISNVTYEDLMRALTLHRIDPIRMALFLPGIEQPLSITFLPLVS